MADIPRVLTVALLSGALLAGCGGRTTPQVATARQPAPAAAVSSPPTASDYDKALRYTRCMNENGQQIPDPVEGEPLPVSAPTDGWQAKGAAYDKCKQFLPATWPVKIDPQEAARDRPFNECMRKNGFPPVEPDADGMYRYPTDDTAQQTPQYEAAVAKCRYLLDDKANNQPENR